MKTRVITALIALVIFLPTLYLGGIALRLLIAALAFVAIMEFFHMKKLKLISFEGLLTLIATYSIIFAKTSIVYLTRQIDFFSVFFLCVMLLLALTVYKSEHFSIEDISFLTLISLYVGGGFSGILFVREFGFGMVLFVFSIIWGTDSFAYLAGRAIGKHKLAPKISPNKTIEGSIGGLVGAVALGLGVSQLFNPMGLQLLEMVTLIVGISVFGQLGDLVESAYKRRFGVKDSGKLFPGHGGVLDRFDSTFFAMFIFQIVIKLFEIS